MAEYEDERGERMNHDQQRYLKKLIRQHQRRLRLLELRAAFLGSEAPPSTPMEIEDLASTISKISALIGDRTLNQKQQAARTSRADISLAILAVLSRQEYYLFGIRIWRYVERKRIQQICHKNCAVCRRMFLKGGDAGSDD